MGHRVEEYRGIMEEYPGIMEEYPGIMKSIMEEYPGWLQMWSSEEKANADRGRW